MIRVLLADDHSLFREGIISLLNEDKDIIVVGQVEDGFGLLEKYDETKPDVVVSDISMPGKSGPDAIRSICKKDKNAKVLFLSQYTGDDYIYEVVKAGGSGLISKNTMLPELLDAIKSVALGNKYFVGKTDKEIDAIIKRFTTIAAKEKRENVNALTKKETEIVLLISENLTSAEIADKLQVSIRTIEAHRFNIIQKLHLKSLRGLIGFAHEFAKQRQVEI
ncbi:MAG: response regulator transcription factor [Melioribacteraceae bacterium]|nr:response regulator transcription factor [Melioribacteraceae bacterium]